MKIYVVLQESDWNIWEIQAIFFDEKKAKKYMEKNTNLMNKDSWKYEEYEVKE